MIISPVIISIVFAFFGLLVGSFLNVVILRHGKMTIQGRSECPQCNHQLSWYELIPVVSFLIQKRQCRNCKKPISWQYVSVELLTAILFFFSAGYLLFFINIFQPIATIICTLSFLTIISFTIIIAVHDIKTQLVPLSWFVGLVIATLVFLISFNFLSGFTIDKLVPHFIGLIISIPFLALWFFSRGKWIGFADIEIIAWIGLFSGVLSGINIVISSFYLGAIFAIVFISIKLLQGYSYQEIRKTRIPFAPFLLAAWFLGILFHWNIFSWILNSLYGIL